MSTASILLIGLGIGLQLIGVAEFMVALGDWLPTCYAASVPVLIGGYYIGMRHRGYRPHSMAGFYGTLLVMLIPYAGAVAAAKKLFFMPKAGAEPPARRTGQTVLWTMAMAVAILALGIVHSGMFVPIHMARRLAPIAGHVAKAEAHIVAATQTGNGRVDRARLDAARREIDLARGQAERLGDTGWYAVRIVSLSGEIHLLRQDWDAAEAEYALVLKDPERYGGPRRDEVIAVARKGLEIVRRERRRRER